MRTRHATSREAPKGRASEHFRRGAVVSIARPIVVRSSVAVVVLLIAFLPFSTPAAEPSHRWFRIEADQYAFDPGTITVNPGDEVTLELVATDVMHGLYVDGYDLEVTAEPGQSASLTFVADRSGTVRLRCSVTCGPLHPFMVGKLRVGESTLLWRGTALALLVALIGIRKVRP